MIGIPERSWRHPPGLGQVWEDYGLGYFSNGLIAFIFSATGPLAIVLSVGSQGGLSEAELSSWVFGIFFINGLVTVTMSWLYRMPLGFAWTIPGTVLVGSALQHLSFPEVIGAFYVISALVFVLGASGWVTRLMSLLPMPIVMGMVSGVFLRFGLDLIRALHQNVLVAAPMICAFLFLSSSASWGRRIPPLIGALLAGAVVVLASNGGGQFSTAEFAFAAPLVQPPVWTTGALFELVIPITITVLVVQNGQGTAVLKAAGHMAPVGAIAMVCGAASAVGAVVGSVSTCLTGPSNALMTSSGTRERQYTAALTFGFIGLLFGLMAPGFTRLMLAAPKEYIMALGGLAMMRVLQGTFIESFGKGKFTLGALVSLLVSVADIGLFNVGAAFWGLLAGVVVSFLMERRDFRNQS